MSTAQLDPFPHLTRSVARKEVCLVDRPCNLVFRILIPVSNHLVEHFIRPEGGIILYALILYQQNADWDFEKCLYKESSLQQKL